MLDLANIRKINLELLYTIVIGYNLIVSIVHELTGLPYTGVVLMYFILIFDIMISKKIRINLAIFALFVGYALFLAGALLLNKNSWNIEYAKCFIVFSIVAMYLSEFEINEQIVENVIRNLAIIYIGYYLLGLQSQSLKNDYFNTSLNILPGIICLFYFTYINILKKKYLMVVILGYLTLISSFSYMEVSSRGPFVSYIAFIAFFLAVENTGKIIKILGFVLCAAGGYIALNIKKFVYWGYKLSNTYNLNIYFFTKSIEKIRTSNISSHRNVLYRKFFEMNSFFFGKGIGGFEAEVGVYPHNIIVAKWVEFGLIGLLWIIVVCFVSGYIIWKDNTRKKIWLIILSSTIFPLMFSFTYWKFPSMFLIEFLCLQFINEQFHKKRGKTILLSENIEDKDFMIT